MDITEFITIRVSFMAAKKVITVIFSIVKLVLYIIALLLIIVLYRSWSIKLGSLGVLVCRLHNSLFL